MIPDKMKDHPLLGAALAAITLAILPATAATMSSSPSAPVIDGEDLANFGTQTATEKWWNDNAAAGAAKGQTFRTRNEALRLKAITYRTTTSTQPTKVFTIRVGTISGTTFTPVYTEICHPDRHLGRKGLCDLAVRHPLRAATEHVLWHRRGHEEFDLRLADGDSVSVGDGGRVFGRRALPLRHQRRGQRHASPAATDDRLFHLDLEKPIGGWSLVATSPADNSTNALHSSPLVATFSQNIGRGTGNITLRNLTDGIDTVIPVNDSRVLISENLLTVNPGSNYLANRAYAVRIDPTAITNVLGANYPGITNDTAWNFSTGAGDPLYLALVALKNHITGASPLNAAQISAHKVTIDQERTRLADSAAMITASFDLVRAYDAASGNHWYVNGLPARDSVVNDIHWTLWNVQQYIMDVTYDAFTLANYESLLNGFKFGSASGFPGACSPPANSNQTHTATISASYLEHSRLDHAGRWQRHVRAQAHRLLPRSRLHRHRHRAGGVGGQGLQDPRRRALVGFFQQAHDQAAGPRHGPLPDQFRGHQNRLPARRRHLHRGAVAREPRGGERAGPQCRALAVFLREEFSSDDADGVAFRAHERRAVGGFPVGQVHDASAAELDLRHARPDPIDEGLGCRHGCL